VFPRGESNPALHMCNCCVIVKPNRLVMDPLVEAALEAARKVDRKVARKEARNFTQCGTFGCVLANLHTGLHKFELSTKRGNCCVPVPNVTADVVEAARQLECLHHTPNVKGFLVQQAVVRVMPEGVVVPCTFLPSIRVRRRWSAEETGTGRAAWYAGIITHISEDYTLVQVNYDDGDQCWEAISDLQFR